MNSFHHLGNELNIRASDTGWGFEGERDITSALQDLAV